MVLKGIVDVFKELVVIVNMFGLDVFVKNFFDVCFCFFVVFKVFKIGMFLRFVEIDYVIKVCFFVLIMKRI